MALWAPHLEPLLMTIRGGRLQLWIEMKIGIKTRLCQIIIDYSCFFLFQVNLLLLVGIVKVVVIKLRVQSSLSTQQLQVRKAVRATLILFPLLGITNLLFFINPKSLQRREHEYLYMLINSVLKSSQVLGVLDNTFKVTCSNFNYLSSRDCSYLCSRFIYITI